MATGNGKPIADPAVPEKPERRRFAAEYKRRVLQEADHCTRPGKLGWAWKLRSSSSQKQVR
jgi:hypothetical protein